MCIIKSDLVDMTSATQGYMKRPTSSARSRRGSMARPCATTSTMHKIDFIEYHSNKRNGNPPRMWSNTSKIGFVPLYDTFRTWDFSPVLYRRHLGYGYGLAI